MSRAGSGLAASTAVLGGSKTHRAHRAEPCDGPEERGAGCSGGTQGYGGGRGLAKMGPREGGKEGGPAQGRGFPGIPFTPSLRDPDCQEISVRTGVGGPHSPQVREGLAGGKHQF